MLSGIISDRDAAGYIHDPLYGRVNYSHDELAIFQTLEAARQRQMTQGSEPFGLPAYGVPSNRFLHGVGVMHNGGYLGSVEAFKEYARELRAFGLFHDNDHPAFCHLGQYYLELLFSLTHEEWSKRHLEDTPLGNLLRKLGYRTDVLVKLTLNELKPYSQTTSGTVDIDNVDNVKRFGHSTGISRKLPEYDPLVISSSYRIVNGKTLCLLESARPHLETWMLWRKTIYDYIYSAEHQCSVAMVHRALEFARQNDELPMRFFSMADPEAEVYLRTQCNPKTQRLMDMARLWQWYYPAYSFYTTENEIAKSALAQSIYSDRHSRNIAADAIARESHIPDDDIVVYYGKNKGVRSIDLPLLTEDGELIPGPPSPYEASYHAYAFLHPRWKGTPQEANVQAMSKTIFDVRE